MRPLRSERNHLQSLGFLSTRPRRLSSARGRFDLEHLSGEGGEQMAVDLDEGLRGLLADHAEWLRLTDKFAPGSRGPLRQVELDPGVHALPVPRPAVEDEAWWAIPGVTGVEVAPQ